jgi:hypothetical protein
MITINEKTILALSPQASFQSLGDGAVILMIDSGQLYSCNETTEAFLKAVDGSRSLAEIIDAVLPEFEVDHETLRNDLLALAADLSSEGIVTSG